MQVEKGVLRRRDPVEKSKILIRKSGDFNHGATVDHLAALGGKRSLPAGVESWTMKPVDGDTKSPPAELFSLARRAAW